MLGCVSTYKRDEHAFIGGEIGHYVNRLAKESGRDLAVIRYERLGVFCIIEFMSPKRDVFIDIMNLGKSLANFDRTKANELLRRLFKPLTCDETSHALAIGESDFHHGLQDENSEETEREERCARGE